MNYEAFRAKLHNKEFEHGGEKYRFNLERYDNDGKPGQVAILLLVWDAKGKYWDAYGWVTRNGAWAGLEAGEFVVCADRPDQAETIMVAWESNLFEKTDKEVVDVDVGDEAEVWKLKEGA